MDNILNGRNAVDSMENHHLMRYSAKNLVQLERHMRAWRHLCTIHVHVNSSNLNKRELLFAREKERKKPRAAFRPGNEHELGT